MKGKLRSHIAWVMVLWLYRYCLKLNGDKVMLPRLLSLKQNTWHRLLVEKRRFIELTALEVQVYDEPAHLWQGSLYSIMWSWMVMLDGVVIGHRRSLHPSFINNHIPRTWWVMWELPRKDSTSNDVKSFYQACLLKITHNSRYHHSREQGALWEKDLYS